MIMAYIRINCSFILGIAKTFRNRWIVLKDVYDEGKFLGVAFKINLYVLGNDFTNHRMIRG